MRLSGSRRKSCAVLTLGIATLLSFVTRLSEAQCNVSCPTCPCFTNGPYNISIPENLPIGRTIATFTATDVDTTDLEYSIISADAFRIDPDRGVLTVAAELDFESNPVYQFRVQASDGMGRGLADVTINLVNVNEYAPQCAASVVYFSTSEELTGETFDLPNCTDADHPDSPRISYEIVSGNEDNKFAINQSNGRISIERALDYEDQTLYELEIAACDENGSTGSLNSSITTIIVVEPVNEHAPVFNRSSQFAFTVSESAQISTTIDHVSASDDDHGLDGTIVYSFESSSPPDVFTIDSHSGDIILTRSLDFEVVDSYQFSVVATDSSSVESDRMSSTATVIVTVLDENDNRPNFSQSVYSTSVREDATINDDIITVSCSDLDISDNVSYSISLGNIGSKFTIDVNTGTISLMNTLDFDDTSQTQLFEITIQCIESNSPRTTVEALVVIEVTSIDEFYPDPGFGYQETVSEDMVPGSSILRIEGRDRDHGPGGLLHYSLNDVPTCPQNLHIDSQTGVLYLLSPFDYEEPPNSVMCTVTVSDSEHPVEADIFVTISNVNDVQPSCDPAVYAVNVSEDTQIGLEFLTLSCSDSDSPTLQYAILQSFPTNPFEISTTGSMTTAELLDFEVQPFYDITVGVSDSNYSTNVTVHVTVNGVNEHSPVFRNSTFECSVTENSHIGTVVCTVSATDEDSGEDGNIRYQIVNTTSDIEAHFEIDQVSGQIYLIRDVDYEIDREYWFTVIANDRGDPSFSGSALVHIGVVDVNDNPPQMEEQLFIFVSETTPSGSVVSTINCHDVDNDRNSITNLLISSLFVINPDSTETPSSAFSINSTSGELTLTGVLDYEDVQFYRLSIVCRDSGTPILATFSTVIIQVLPVNEFIPQFNESSYHLNVEELSEIGTSIATFFASDRDTGTDGETRYSIAPGESVPFAINQQSGLLSVFRRLNCADRREYNFVIEVRDGGSPSLQSNASVTVNVVHCHLGQLLALSDVYATSVAENAPMGTSILTVTCNSTRAFIPGISPPLYEIIGSDIDTFEIDSTIGEITIRNPPDYESQSSHMLQIRCYDPHNADIATNITAYISITPMNEHTPTFTQPMYTVSISEDTLLGTTVTQVQATDADHGRDGEITYQIQDTRSFLINSQSGTIFLSTSLDRESVDQVVFTVIAQDNPSDPVSVPQSSYAQVTILVQDSNDHWPDCERTVYHLIVSPNTQTSSTILDSLNCSDADVGDNSLLEYFINDETLSNTFALDRRQGRLTLLSKLDPNDSPVHHIPVTVRDLGTPSYSISVLVVIEVQEPPLPDRTPGDDGDYLSLVEAEGLRNSVTITLNDFSKALWEERDEANKSFQDAIARSVTKYCALLPEACSLVSGCAQFFGYSNNGRRKRNENSNYISFAKSTIRILPNVTEISFETSPTEVSTTTTETVSLQVKFYVKLPDEASRAPYRETNYVVPRATLNRIIDQDETVIEAVVRDSVSPYLTVNKTIDSWFVTGVLLLVVLSIIVSVVLLAGIVAVGYKYKQKESRVVPIRVINSISNRNDQAHPASKTRSDTSTQDNLPTFEIFRGHTNENAVASQRGSDTSPFDDSISDVSEISLDNEGASMENNASSGNSELSQSQGLSSGFGDSLNTQITTTRTGNIPTVAQDQLFGSGLTDDNFPYTLPRQPLQRVPNRIWSMSYGDL